MALAPSFTQSNYFLCLTCRESHTKRSYYVGARYLYINDNEICKYRLRTINRLEQIFNLINRFTNVIYKDLSLGLLFLKYPYPFFAFISKNI